MKIYQSIFAVTLIFSASLANAASWLECDGDSGKKQTWGGNSTTVRINSNSYSPGWQSRIEDAIGIVNYNPSPFWINSVVEGGTVGSCNDQNEIYAADISPPGVARMRYYCYWLFGWEWGLTEVDVVLDTKKDDGTPHAWTTSSNKSQIDRYGGSNLMAESVFVHEFGHFLGLMHLNTAYNIMGDSWDHMITQNGKTRSYLGESASLGARVLYGTQNTWYRDLSMSHFRHTGADGEYSTHGRTRAFRNNGTGWVQTGVYGGGDGGSVIEPIWEVDLGELIRFEYTLENNGKQDENNVRGGLYISTNDWISKYDQLIGTNVWPLISAQGAAYTFQLEITIPNDLQRGRVYWVGYIIDDNNTVHEKTGKNNAAYVPVWIN